MTTENQTVLNEKKLLNPTRSAPSTSKRTTMKTSSLKPTRSLKKSSGIKPNPLKLK